MSKHQIHRTSAGLRRAVVLLIGLVMLTLSSTPAAQAQQVSDLIEMRVDAGYDGFFRPNRWFPIRVTITNNDDTITGRLVVRPETSGSGLPNTYSTPVDLPTGSTQVITLYITAYDNARDIRVELLGDDDRVISGQDTVVRRVPSRDKLFVVVSNAAGGSVINLSTVRVGGYEAVQANWSVDDLPDQAATLEAVNAILINDTDTGTLSPVQRDALRDYVIAGGHLIVTGGAAWQSTAAGLDALLPFEPDASETADDLRALIEFSGDYALNFDEDFIIATGDLAEGGVVLVENSAGLPLLVRRELGSGTVDYMTVDPNTQPLRGWDGLSGLWFTMLTTIDVQPSWSYGFSNWSFAEEASRIFPGLDLLPPILTLIGFLVIYLVLVGPANYFLLARINRLDWAWFTIPVLIIIFTVLARVIGFDLRGNQVTLNRLTVVQSWQNSDVAQIDQVVGLLAPRRTNYSLEMPDDRLLRPIPDLGFTPAGVLSERTIANVTIEQTETFGAVDFPLDAGFIAGFATTGTLPRPEISGSVTITYNVEDPFISVQGAIRNDSDIPLNDAVILARGVVVRLSDTIEPGEIETFNASGLPYRDIDTPAPTPLEYVSGEATPFLVSGSFFRSATQTYANEANTTLIQILGEDNFEQFGAPIDFIEDSQTQTERRRQAFLSSFMVDQFASTSRGNQVYLAAWSDAVPYGDDNNAVVSGAGWEPLDTTLYLIELESEISQPDNDQIRIGQDQFSWVSRSRLGTDDVGPYNISLYNQSEAIFRFTPLPDSVLNEVDEMNVIVERTNNISSLLQLEIWNWRDEAWESLDVDREARIRIRNPREYLGPMNAVELRLQRPDTGSTIFVQQLAIEQVGTF